MPIYEYECRRCGHKFDAFRSMTESKNDESCTECGDVSKRIMSPVTFKSFVGSVTYDKINNFPPGTSAADYK